ncbi:ABC transporter ATP-binding protein [Haladaptatus cibarius]|uniref:ABC transporter ATP-binding protein n=1 Tax=Haladaptatus cibarius TaxID=453847 RepID=UPI00067881C8|nr:ABC transporter ATP-binding protein [Haladaptatus cibarius]
MTQPLLKIDDLHVHFHTEEGTVEALDGVNLEIYEDEVLGIIGESGCGKSVTALSTIGLLQSPPAEIVSGSIEYAGRDILSHSQRELNNIRGNDVTMVYQDPMTSLNPVLTIGKQVTEPLRTHSDVSASAARQQAIEMLEACGLADADRIMDQYPNELSGGMRQRVVIAMALITEPKLLLADEPTTALDVTIQAQIMDLLKELQEEFGMSILFISHDLGVISEIADRIAVMYAGNIVENCTMRELFDAPLHPYTRALSKSIPSLSDDPDRLPVIEGVVPDLRNPPSGCRFASRCPQYIGDVCDAVDPALTTANGFEKHEVACHLYTDIAAETPPADWEYPSAPSTGASSHTEPGESQ